MDDLNPDQLQKILQGYGVKFYFLPDLEKWNYRQTLDKDECGLVHSFDSYQEMCDHLINKFTPGIEESLNKWMRDNDIFYIYNATDRLWEYMKKGVIFHKLGFKSVTDLKVYLITKMNYYRGKNDRRSSVQRSSFEGNRKNEPGTTN